MWCCGSVPTGCGWWGRWRCCTLGYPENFGQTETTEKKNGRKQYGNPAGKMCSSVTQCWPQVNGIMGVKGFLAGLRGQEGSWNFSGGYTERSRARHICHISKWYQKRYFQAQLPKVMGQKAGTGPGAGDPFATSNHTPRTISQSARHTHRTLNLWQKERKKGPQTTDLMMGKEGSSRGVAGRKVEDTRAVAQLPARCDSPFPLPLPFHTNGSKSNLIEAQKSVAYFCGQWNDCAWLPIQSPLVQAMAMAQTGF